MMLDTEKETEPGFARRGVAKLALSMALLLSLVAVASAQAQAPKTQLKVGDPAPEFVRTVPPVR